MAKRKLKRKVHHHRNTRAKRQRHRTPSWWRLARAQMRKLSRSKKPKRRRKNRWIKGAIKRPGALHRALKIPKGKKIPYRKLLRAAKRKGKLGERARFALNMRRAQRRAQRKRRR